MNDVESDFDDYQSARDLEGGPHQGRSDFPRGLNLVVGFAVGLLLLAAGALVFIG